ncbi:MAG: flagellar M-ring protein FliF [Clostridia bacterium]|nr:flagellar basal-body MS-ring/collar protein FliF [Candidatus Pelethousia sp.]NCB30015.1 flagellar M-ring protein FliF [Clostridia bacterium]
MEEKKPTLAQRAISFWNSLNRALRIAIAAVLGLLLVLIIYLLATAGRVEYEVLQMGLTSKEAANATAILGDLGIPYTVEGISSVTIRVPRGTRSQVMLQLQSEGYPASDADLYKFYTENASGMGVTDQDKRVYDRFATEQRLAYLIRQMEKVQDAGVMVTLPQTSQFALSENNQNAQASVVLSLEPGVTLTDTEAEAVRSLVVTAVAGLQPENVTITDTNLHVYEQPNAEGVGGVYVADQIALKQQHQQLIQDQVYNFLNPVFGTGNVVVSASVDLDFDKKSIQTVTYSPPGDADNMGIIVSLQQAAERAGVTEMAEGVAGFDANGAAPFYPETVEGDTAPVYSYSQQLNAEVNEVRQQIEEAQGKVTGLSVSIMIDADEGLDEELENVRSLVANGLGVDAKYISILRTSFKVNEDYQKMLDEQAAADAALADADGAVKRQAFAVAAGVVTLALLVALIILAVSSRRRRLGYEAELARIEEAREAEVRQALEEATLRERIGEPDDSASLSRLKDIQKMASEKPDVVAQLLRNWLTDEYR